MPDIADRFWAKVDKNGPVHPLLGTPCWLWTAGTDEFGYGLIGAGGKHGGSLLAHRVAWEIQDGPIPEGMCVLHSCDNPPCVNRAHLFLGTKADNNHDCIEKGRARHVWPVGEASHLAKITADTVREIRSTPRLPGESANQFHIRLAGVYGFSRNGILAIVKRKTWRHVA
jgi:hypothetical protein